MNQLSEGVEMGDLARLVQPILSIDEFRSKMGEDKDIIVVGFTVMGKSPADDIVSFIEKSYDWILDADVSSGETEDGNYMVFAEFERTKSAPSHIMSMITDLVNLTDQEVKDWQFTYYKHSTGIPLTEENLVKTMLLTPESYNTKVEASAVDAIKESTLLNQYRAMAGVRVPAAKIVDMQILNMQRAAGIK